MFISRKEKERMKDDIAYLDKEVTALREACSLFIPMEKNDNDNNPNGATTYTRQWDRIPLSKVIKTILDYFNLTISIEEPKNNMEIIIKKKEEK